MNDFTKDELEDLISTIKSLRIYTGIDNWDEDLEFKIQSMINNYCNHLWDDAATNQFYCIKCQKHLDKINE